MRRTVIFGMRDVLVRLGVSGGILVVLSSIRYCCRDGGRHRGRDRCDSHEVYIHIGLVTFRHKHYIGPVSVPVLFQGDLVRSFDQITFVPGVNPMYSLST